MRDLVEHIVEKEHTKANELFEQHMSDIVDSKLHEVKKMIAARIDEQITVQNNGMHLTATGEEVLPSVIRQRRQLAEGEWSKKVRRGDSAAVVKRKKVLAKRKARPGPGMSDERYAELVAKSAAAKRKPKPAQKVQAASTEQEAKASEITKEADPYAKKVGRRAGRIERIFGPTAAQRYKEKAFEKRPRPLPVGYNNMSWPKRILYKFGILEEAKMRARDILESKTYSGTRSAVMQPNKGEHVVYANEDKNRVLGKFNNAEEAKKFAAEQDGHYSGPHKG